MPAYSRQTSALNKLTRPLTLATFAHRALAHEPDAAFGVVHDQDRKDVTLSVAVVDGQVEENDGRGWRRLSSGLSGGWLERNSTLQLPVVKDLEIIANEVHDRVAVGGGWTQGKESYALNLTPAEMADELTVFQAVEDLGPTEVNTRYFDHRTDKLSLVGRGGHLVTPRPS